MAAELTRKTPRPSSTPARRDRPRGYPWPAGQWHAAAGLRGGRLLWRRNGLCGCQTQAVVYPLALEEMILGFDHSFDTEDDGWLVRPR